MLKHCFHDLEIIYRILFVFFDVKFWPFRGHKLPINIRKWQNLPQETFCFLHCKQTNKQKNWRYLLNCYFWTITKNKLLQSCVALPEAVSHCPEPFLCSAALHHCNPTGRETGFFSCCCEWLWMIWTAVLTASSLACRSCLTLLVAL